MGNIFTEKSDESWKAGNECLRQGLVNAAASRIYYSVFQAVMGFGIAKERWDVEEREGLHSKAPYVAGNSCVVKGRWCRRILISLRELRVMADYKPEGVDVKQLNLLLADADKVRRHHIDMSV